MGWVLFYNDGVDRGCDMPEYDEKKVGRRCIECGCNFLSWLPWRRCWPCRKALRASLRYELYLKYVPLRWRPLVARVLVGNEWVLGVVILWLVLNIVWRWLV